MKKMSLYKYTHIPLLKNDAQLKQKSDNQPKKKKNHLNLLKNKTCPQKKSLVKQKEEKKRKEKKNKTKQNKAPRHNPKKSK